MADAVNSALPSQANPLSYCNIECMFRSMIGKGGLAKFCGTGSEARGINRLAYLNKIKTPREFIFLAGRFCSCINFYCQCLSSQMAPNKNIAINPPTPTRFARFDTGVASSLINSTAVGVKLRR